MPLFSIIVPVYNVEKYLDKCVSSILEQSFKDFELILVDDGSPDNCPAICDSYAKKDSRVKVIHKQNGGLINARKSGLEIAESEYIGFVDGDDWIEPDTYENFAAMINKYKPDMVLSDFYFDEGNKIISSDQLFKQEFYDKTALKNELYPIMLYSGKYYKFGVNPCCWSKVYKNELIKKNLPLVDGRIKMGEDAAFTYPCLLDATSVAAIKKPSYHYISNNQSMTNSYDKDLKNIIFLPYERIIEKSRECGTDLGRQTDYYLLYLANFLLRNETRAEDPKSGISTLLKNSNVIKAAKYINLSNLPLHTKVFATALRFKSRSILKTYRLLLKFFI